ncbi:hypothetical protein PVBG_05735 [Plasmodium vivax Brazil I]|uniref:Variable surface protein Vir35 n=1 Tax=Plasmodium vivax (strain Brazil I) TaxID=1033975 RepID=A0A0J9SK45_PLAV1|nr:hypothetical protein PVBG_05735 [Plasmodium vivax Brazil I]
MVILRNYNIKENIKYMFLLRIFAFIFLIWIYHSDNDTYIFSKLFDNKNENHKSLSIKYNRLMAKYGLQSELEYTNVRDNISDNTTHNRKKKLADHYSTYSQLKRKESNNLDVYMNDYKRRYRKKNGLLKLDCYFEKKVFDRIHSINEIAHKYQNNEKGFKKFLFKKYGIFLILLSLYPGIGLAFPILFGTKNGLSGIYNKICNNTGHSYNSPGNCTDLHLDDWKTSVEYMGLYLKIFSIGMVVIILLFFIYILIKVIKYEKLKAGKFKMNINEYYHLCKNIF